MHGDLFNRASKFKHNMLTVNSNTLTNIFETCLANIVGETSFEKIYASVFS